MMLTMIPFSISAETTSGATAITSAAEFAAMEEDGNYYLANGITISATYEKTFKGTFDGRGFTVITTVPLFKEVRNATIENLVMTGFVKGMASVASYVTGNTTFNNIVNECTINATGTNAYLEGDFSSNVTSTDSIAGGIAGLVIGTTLDKDNNVETKVVFENCINKGSVTVTDITKNGSAGGVIGAAMFHSSFGNGDFLNKLNIEFVNCKNTADIEAVNHAGGIIGYTMNLKSISFNLCENSGNIKCNANGGGIIGYCQITSTPTVVTDCYNSGNVTFRTADVKSQLGGVAGYLRCSAQVINCYNSGAITSTDHAAGIVGRIADKSSYIYCVNTGSIDANSDNADYVGGILGYDGGIENDIYYCYNTGSIKTNGYGGGISGRIHNILSDVVGCYNSGTISLHEGATTDKRGQMFQGGDYGMLLNNYYEKSQSDAGVRAYYLKGLEIDNMDAISYELADVASGKLAHDMNKSIGAQVYYQNLTDANAVKYPTLNANDGAVIKSGENYYSVRIETADKAAVRIDGVKTGLRVTTAVNKADYDKLMAAGISANDLTFGTVFTSDAYIKAVAEAGGVFSMASLDEFLTDISAYVDVPVAKKGTEGFYATDADAYHFRGALVNISNENLAEDFSAIGYVKLGEDIVYSGYYTTVSIAEISKMAYEDRADAADTTYAQSIAANSEVAIGAVVTYSPYTEVQLKALKSYFN